MTNVSDSKAVRIRKMFARIVPNYDLINTLMTLGLDRRWRAETVNRVGPKDGVVLDIATGTGDLAFEMARKGANVVIGADFCPEMIDAAVKKSIKLGFRERVSFMVADATRLPFANETFDCVVNGFMLRNVEDLTGTLKELCRVLKPGGRLACLDLTQPRGVLRYFFQFYMGSIVPLFGVMFGRNYDAYHYFYRSLSGHPDPDRLAAILREAGFAEADYKIVGFGTVAIHLAVKAGTADRARATAL